MGRKKKRKPYTKKNHAYWAKGGSLGKIKKVLQDDTMVTNHKIDNKHRKLVISKNVTRCVFRIDDITLEIEVK